MVKLPAERTGFREPLLVRGTSGRADVVIVEYLDPGHIVFALDHWGGAFVQSKPVPVEYSRVHDIEIELPSPGEAPSGSAIAGTAIIRVDGAEAWKVAQKFYASDAAPVLVANNIGASTCERAFTGTILSASGP
jgi:hypothetical protein